MTRWIHVFNLFIPGYISKIIGGNTLFTLATTVVKTPPTIDISYASILAPGRFELTVEKPDGNTHHQTAIRRKDCRRRGCYGYEA